MSRYHLNCECGQPLEFDSALFDYPWICPLCRRDFVIETPDPGSALACEAQPCSLDWPRWPRIGVARAAARTAKQVLTNPAGAFACAPHPTRAAYWSYFLVLAVFAVGVRFLLRAPGIFSGPHDFGDINPAGARAVAAAHALTAVVFWVREFINLVGVLVQELMFAGLCCLFLRLFGLFPPPRFNKILMTFVFCAGSALPLTVLPAIGPLLFLCWSTYCKVAALRSSYRLTKPLAIAAVLAPMILLLLLGAMLFMKDPAAFQGAMRN